ncbi:MAG: nucleoside triphosphate pyrophosphohydrolase [Ignavibacteriales bacterium]|nr:nucleoside triphosphate pyrophosphohydrolase [Ignavibacteriales bacterium]
MARSRSTSGHFEEFLAVVRRLRKDCPWDREQTHESIRHSLIEETYEVVEAIDRRNPEELKSELGDLLLHVALHSVIAEESREFSLEDVLAAETSKLIRRHPHVFGDVKVTSAKDVKANWEKIKLKEGRSSALDGVPRELPALLRAFRIQEKASKVGFDWAGKEDVWKKVTEELGEFRSAEEDATTSAIEEEFGDLLFSLVNYARFLSVNPELALRKTAEKFERRFRKVEIELRKKGKTPEEASMEEMDLLWNAEKAARR